MMDCLIVRLCVVEQRANPPSLPLLRYCIYFFVRDLIFFLSLSPARKQVYFFKMAGFGFSPPGAQPCLVVLNQGCGNERLITVVGGFVVTWRWMGNE
jgi:hypothetical protein